MIYGGNNTREKAKSTFTEHIVYFNQEKKLIAFM